MLRPFAHLVRSELNGLARRAHWSPDSLLTDDKLRHRVHNLVESFEGCVNLDSVIGLRQGDAARDLSAASRAASDCAVASTSPPRPLFLILSCAAGRPRCLICSQEHLEVSIREHGRSDIATFHNDASSCGFGIGGFGALTIEQHRANFWHRTNCRHHRRHGICSNRLCHVDSVNRDGWSVGVSATRQFHVGDLRGNTCRVGCIDAVLVHPQRDCSVHGAGIEVAKAERRGHCAKRSTYRT